MKSRKVLKKELMKDKAVAREYKRLALRYEFISSLIEARKKMGLTQEELAKKIGTKQASIARLESGRANPTIGFLEKLAKALDSKLTVKLE